MNGYIARKLNSRTHHRQTLHVQCRNEIELATLWMSNLLLCYMFGYTILLYEKYCSLENKSLFLKIMRFYSFWYLGTFLAK